MPESQELPTRGRDLKKVDLNLLLIFEAIYQSRSVSRAADALKMSQPTVSNALNRLRTQFDDRLFIRSDRGVRPTPLAEALSGPISEALNTLRGGLQMQADFDLKTANRQFRVMMHDYSLVSVLPPLVRLLDQVDSSCSVEMLTPDPTRPEDAVLNGETDVLLDVLPQEVPGLEIEAMHEAWPVCIVREDHPTIRDQMTGALFESCGHAIFKNNLRRGLNVPHLLTEHKLHRREVVYLPNAADLAATIATTDLIGVVPERYARIVAPIYRLRILPTPFKYPPLKTYLIWNESKNADPGHTWLRNAIRGIFKG